MMRLQPALAVCLSVVVGLAAVMSVAEARGGAGVRGGGGFGGGGGFRGGGGYRGRGGNVNPGFGPRGNGYGFYPPGRRTNPYARNAIPWIDMDYDDLVPEDYYQNNSGSSQPNDCNYLYQKALESNSPSMWKLFNDCAHGR